MSDLTLWSWVFVGLYIIGIVILTYIGARRTKTLEDFTTAPRSYGWVVISFATVAAWCSAAAFLGQPGMGYGTGFPALWYVMGYSFSALCWALSMFGIWKVGAKLGAKTPADFLGKRFNSDLVKAVTALIVILNIYYVAGQFVGIGWLFNVALKIPYLYGVIVAAAFTAIYIIIGGTHSDLLTDAAQGMSMAVAAILVLFVAFLFVTPGGVPAVNASIVAQDPQLGWDNIFSSGNAMFAAFPAISICFGLGFGALSPQMSKNFLAIKNKKDVYKVAIAGAVLMFLMSFMMLGGIGARAALGDQFVAQPDMALPTLLTQSLPAPLAALIAIAILAAIMSSADGLYLVIANAISVDLYKDIIAPRLHKKNPLSQEVLEKRSLLLSRILIVIVTIVAVIIAYPPPQYLTALIWAGLGGITCAVSPSVLFGAFWRRTTPVASAVSMIVSIIVYLVSLLGLKYHPYKAVGIGLIVSISLIIIVSLITKPQTKEELKEIFG